MAVNKNIQIKQHNGIDWDTLFPKTLASITQLNDGTTVQSTVTNILTDLANKVELADVTAEIEAVVGAAPEALDTLTEIANALNNDPDFAATITNQLSTKVDKVTGKGLSTNDFTDALQTALNTAVTDIGTLQTDVSANKSSITSLQTNVTAAQGDISTLQTDLGTAQGNISTLQTDLGTAQGDITTLQGNVSTLQTDKADAASVYTRTEVDTRIQESSTVTSPTEPTNGSNLWFQEI